MRRAMSAQAAFRCADNSSVMSSKVTTKPLMSGPLCSAAMRTSSVRVLLPRTSWTCDSANRSGRRSASASSPAISGATSARSCPIDCSRSAPRSADAERLGKLTRPRLSSPITPAETPVNTVSVNRRRSSICLLELALLALDLVSHAVERAAQRGELVILLAFGDASSEIPAADLLGRHDQPADRTGKLSCEMNPDGYRCDQE